MFYDNDDNDNDDNDDNYEDNYEDDSPWQGMSRGLHWPSHSLLTFFIIYYDDDDQCNDNGNFLE